MINLCVRTDKKIHELTKKELGSVIWHYLNKEDYETIDAATYKKLTSEGRHYVCNNVYKYEDKPIEYWNTVFSFKIPFDWFIDLLFQNAKNPKVLYENHKEFLMTKLNSSQIIECGLLSFSEYLTKHGENLNWIDDYEVFASPHIPLSFFNEVLDETTKITALQKIRELADDDDELEEYIILAPNQMLVQAGYPEVFDITLQSLKQHKACAGGRRFAIEMFEAFETEVITWDFAVQYLRDNPEKCTGEMFEHLEWWWSESMSD